MAETSFQRFINQEIPRRISTDVPISGNLPSGKFLRTTGIGLNVEIIDSVPGSPIINIEQTAHDFSVMTPIYYDGNRWQKARANKSFTLATHIVIATIDANNFQTAMIGRYTITDHGLVPGEYYYTSADYEGQLTPNEPDDFSNPIVFVESSNIVHILPYRPSISTPTVKTTTVSELFKQIIVVDSDLRLSRTIQLNYNHVEDTESVTLNGLLLEKNEDYIIQNNAQNDTMEELVFKLDVILTDGDRIVIKATYESVV